jgi:hypothetical protein
MTRPNMPGPAWSLLRQLSRGPLPMAEISAAVVGHLTRNGLAAGCQIDNPYGTAARSVPGLAITEAGRAALDA